MEEEIVNLKSKISGLKLEISDKDVQIEKLEMLLDDVRDYLSEMDKILR